MTLTQYPRLTETLLDLACYNNAIRRDRSAESFLTLCEHILSGDDVDEPDIQAAEAWIYTLDDEEKLTLADGEMTDREELLLTAPRNEAGEVWIEILLTRVFEEM